MTTIRSAILTAFCFGLTALAATASSGAEADGKAAQAPSAAAAELPGDFVVEPKPVLRVYWPTWFCCAGARHVLVDLRNTTKQPAAFQPPQALSLTNQRGDRVYAVASGQSPSVDASKCRSPLAPGESCPLDVTFASPLPPGEYALDLGVAGASGGWSQKSVKISVRHTFYLAFVVIAAGVALGWYVQTWRSGGRRAFAAMLALAQLRERLRRIARATPSSALKAIETPIEDEISALESRGQSGADVTADLDRLGLKLTQLAATSAIEASYAALPAEGRTALAAQRNALLARTAKSDAEAAARDAFDNLRRALATNINDWPQLAAALIDGRAAHQLARRALRLAVPAPTRAELETADNALVGALAAALATVAADSAAADVAARAQTLAKAKADVELAAGAATKAYAEATAQRPADDAARKLADAVVKAAAIEDLGARLTAIEKAPVSNLEEVAASDQPSSRPTPPAAAPNLDMPVAAMFDLASGKSAAQWRRSAQLQEWATNLAVLIATSLGGVVLLASNETWGAGVDVVSAFLGGFGARVILGELGAAATPTPK